MEAQGAVRVEPGELEALQDVEHQQRDHALAVGRALIDLMAAVGGADRVDELAGRAREVVDGVQAAGLGEEPHHALGELTPVERFGPVRRDPLQGVGERRQADLLAGGRRMIVGQVEDAACGAAQQAFAGLCPVMGDPRGDDEAALGVADGGLQELVQPLAAVGREQPRPGIDRARHGHAMGVGVEIGHALLPQALEARRGRRPAGAVEGDDAAARRRQQHEAVAADAGHRRLDHALHGDGRDRGVDRVAAGAQHVERGQRRRRMRCRRHAALAVGDRPPRQREVTHATPSSNSVRRASLYRGERFQAKPCDWRFPWSAQELQSRRGRSESSAGMNRWAPVQRIA